MQGLVDDQDELEAQVLTAALHPDLDASATAITAPAFDAVLTAIDKAVEQCNSDELRTAYRTIIQSIRDPSRVNDPRYCYSVSQDKFDYVVDKLLECVEGMPLQNGTARFVESIKTATVAYWNWGTLEEHVGPVMHALNMSWSVQRAREMGLDDATVGAIS